MACLRPAQRLNRSVHAGYPGAVHYAARPGALFTDVLAAMQADIFYIPAAARLDFALAAAAVARSGLHNDIIMAVLLNIVTEEDGKVDLMQVYRLEFEFSKTASVAEVQDKLRPEGVANGCFAIHPFQMTQKTPREEFLHWWTEGYSCGGTAARQP